MPDINPAYYQSVSDYLRALSFTVENDCFVRGKISIPAHEIIGFTPLTFRDKAKSKGWLDEPKEEEDFHPMYQFGDQFVFACDLSASDMDKEIAIVFPEGKWVTLDLKYINSGAEEKEKPAIDFRNDNVIWEEGLADFQTLLVSSQQPLGREFEQVLDDHFWDLIVRT